ncbi:MAG: DUF5906 domain-containing protein [Notoacmeibacter sp.]|nr:DUF5906 domain-containing protein [Notoacmeibacter sp.]
MARSGSKGGKPPGDGSNVVRLPSAVAEQIAEAERQRGAAGAAGRAAEAPPKGGDPGKTGISVLDDHGIDDGDVLRRMNREFALVAIGGSIGVIWDRPGADRGEEARILKLSTFRELLANRRTVYEGSDGKEKSATFAESWLASPYRRTYQGLEFFPTATGEEGKSGFYNLWRGFAVESKAGGTYGVFRDHLQNIVCGGDERIFTWLFGWFAQMLQRPREKPGTAVVLRGGQGVGKTIVGEVVGSLLGPHWTLVDDPRFLTGQFNAHMAACLLLQADEAVWGGDKAGEGRLKGLITASSQMIEAKGVDPVPLANHIRVLMTSNSDYVAPAGKDERRYLVLDVGNQAQRNTAYFGEMIAELDAGGREALLHDLLTFDLSAVDLRETPKTGALLEQKVHHLDPIESWLLDRLKAGAPTRRHETWPDHVEVQEFYEDFVTATERIGIRRKAGETAFAIKVRALIPRLTKRRATVPGEGASMRRPRVYILPPLAEARELFEVNLQQQINWEDPPDE